MRLSEQTRIVKLIWIILIVAGLVALIAGRWNAAFVAFVTLLLTFAPLVFEEFYTIKLPVGFITAIVIFICATLFLGEVGDFYERYWWWDVVLHAGSAMGFGLIGFVLLFIMFKGDKFAAPPITIAFFAFCFAITIGALWEVFEFLMDQFFGFNMQKSGLVDTMSDLIIDAVGALIGSASGFFYLKGQQVGGLAAMIDEFVSSNKRFFRQD